MKILKIIPMYLLILVIGLMIIPNISAETTYFTDFENCKDGSDISLNWIISYPDSWQTTNIWAKCIVYEKAHSGNKCFGAEQNHPTYLQNFWNWDYNLDEGQDLKKWDSYINFFDILRDDYFILEFYDSYGVKFLVFKTEYTSDSDLALSYCIEGEIKNEKILGYSIQENWENFGFEILSNNSIRYYLGDYSIIDKPFNVVKTKFPRLVRTSFFLKRNSLYFDDLTVFTNHKPTANPGGPYLGNKNEQVTFDGSNSTDLDGTISSYSWDFGDGNTGTGQKPTHTYNNAGTYTVKLTVTDNDDGENSETTSIIITESESNSNGNKSPGFELTIFISILALIIIKHRRKKQ